MTSELIVFYNVENLFPPDQEKSDVRPSGLRNWDAYKYGLKIRKLANLFRFMEEDYGLLPSVIGLAEIGSRSVLDDLTDDHSPLNHYEIVYQPSNDSRGLSVALLFDRSKYSLPKFETLQFIHDDNPAFETRDILHTELIFNGKKLHFLVCHLPSKREKDIKKLQRDYIIGKLHELIQKLTEEGQSVVLMGDFNENPDAESLQQLLLDKNGNKMLSNPFFSLHKDQKFSTFHGKKGVLFDQILYTEELITQQFNLQTIDAEIYNTPRLRNKDRKNSSYPLRTYSGSRYIGGWSDHFPVVVKLTDKPITSAH